MAPMTRYTGQASIAAVHLSTAGSIQDGPQVLLQADFIEVVATRENEFGATPFFRLGTSRREPFEVFSSQKQHETRDFWWFVGLDLGVPGLANSCRALLYDAKTRCGH